MTQNPTARMAGDKVFPNPAAAVDDISPGAIVAIAGFAGCGWPNNLIAALHAKGVGNLTLICQGLWRDGSGQDGESNQIKMLISSGQVARLISPMPFYPANSVDPDLSGTPWMSGDLAVETIPQGTLAERLRAGGAGLGGVFIPTGAGTRFAEGKEVRRFGGRDHVFESALRVDFALLRGRAADSLGNVTYRGTERNWNPVMAMAATVSIVEVDEVFEPGGIDPELVITPGIFVNRIVQTR